MPDVGGCVRWFLTLGGSTVSPDTKISFKNICVYLYQTYMYHSFVLFFR